MPPIYTTADPSLRGQISVMPRKIQKPGDHPNFRKNALRVKRPFSELAESSGVFSEQLSEFGK